MILFIFRACLKFFSRFVVILINVVFFKVLNLILSWLKLNKNKQFRDVKVVINYALKNFIKLLFTYVAE